MQGRLSSLHKNRAENGVRTRDLRLGKPTLYQLSYFRKSPQSMRDCKYNDFYYYRKNPYDFWKTNSPTGTRTS